MPGISAPGDGGLLRNMEAREDEEFEWKVSDWFGVVSRQRIGVLQSSKGFVLWCKLRVAAPLAVSAAHRFLRVSTSDFLEHHHRSSTPREIDNVRPVITNEHSVVHFCNNLLSGDDHLVADQLQWQIMMSASLTGSPSAVTCKITIPSDGPAP